MKKARTKRAGTPKEAPTQAIKGRILVESLEDPIREIVCSMLTAAGYECLQAASPKKVLDTLNAREEVELLLCSLSESLEAGLLERMSEGFPDIPVVVMTAVHDISIPLAAIRAGAYDYLLKPFEREQLLAVVRRALEYRRLKLENRALQLKLENIGKETCQPGETPMIEGPSQRPAAQERWIACYDLKYAATSVLGYLELISEPENKERIPELVEKALKNATWLRKLVDRLRFGNILEAEVPPELSQPGQGWPELSPPLDDSSPKVPNKRKKLLDAAIRKEQERD